MSWLGLLRAVISLASTLVGLYERNKLISAGEAQAVLRGLKVSNECISRAIKARRKAESDPLDSDGDGLLDDDGFGK